MKAKKLAETACERRNVNGGQNDTTQSGQEKELCERQRGRNDGSVISNAIGAKRIILVCGDHPKSWKNAPGMQGQMKIFHVGSH